jgi:hypothetical protein
MLSRIFNISLRVSVLAGVLLVASGCLSLFYWISYDGVWNSFKWEVESVRGWVHLRVTDVTGEPPGIEGVTDIPYGLLACSAGTAKEAESELEFSPKVQSFPSGSPMAVEKGDGVVGFVAPYWLLSGIVLLPPAVRWGKALLARRRRERLRTLRICGRCGYDLRASADRCPECGQPFALKVEPDNGSEKAGPEKGP